MSRFYSLYLINEVWGEERSAFKKSGTSNPILPGKGGVEARGCGGFWGQLEALSESRSRHHEYDDKDSL